MLPQPTPPTPQVPLGSRSAQPAMFAQLSAVALFGALALSPVAYGSGVGLQRRAAEFFNPAAGGGTMFVDTLNGLGEPLNVSTYHHVYLFVQSGLTWRAM